MPQPWYAPLRHALFFAEIISGHIISATIALFGGFWLHHVLVEHGDPKAYDLVPWRYVVDTGDLVILIALTVSAVIEIRNATLEEGEQP